MGRGDSVSRVLRIIQYLERAPNGLTVKEVLLKLNDDQIVCSERTVYRDLEVISQSHFPIASESVTSGLEDRSVWKFSRTAAISNKVYFEAHEIFALYLARESLKAMRGSQLIEDILRMTEKLEQALGPGVEKELSNLKSYVTFRASPTWQSGVSQEILDTVHSACWERNVLQIEYRSKSGANKDQIKTRKLGAEKLYFGGGGAYLIAKDLEDNVVKTYSLARIFSATCTDEEYQGEAFNVDKFIGDNFGILSEGEVQEVRIRIEDPIAGFVSERRWHDSQQIIRHQNGVELTMRVKINDELARWVLSLGPSATVHAPYSLVTLMQNLSASIFEKYKPLKAG